MRIAVLCNDRLGLPALQYLAQNRLVQAVATSDRSPEMIAIMKMITQQGGVPSQVFSKKNLEASLTEWLNKYQPDVVLVKTFPFRIPAEALRYPKYGFINFHYAPLPAYRGSNPLFWMIREGMTTGGIAVHRMDENFDTGPILLEQTVAFPPDASFGICSAHLGHAGAQLTAALLQGLQAGSLVEKVQDPAQAHWYGRPAPADFTINWTTMNAMQIKALINACNPWLKGAATRWRGIPLTITDASLPETEVPAGTLPGTVFTLSEKDGLLIACTGGKALRAEVIGLEEGFFGPAKMLQFGMKTGDRLG